MDEIKLDLSINNNITPNKPENNFYEILVYLAIYMSIGVIGLIIKYIQENFFGKKVSIKKQIFSLILQICFIIHFLISSTFLLK